MTPAQARAARAKTLRELAQQVKRASRAELVKLRERVRELRRERAAAIRAARSACSRRAAGIPTTREALAMLRAARLEAKATCATAKARAARIKDDAKRARAEREAERAHQAHMRLIDRQHKERQRPTVAKAVRRQESDDEVRANIPPELVYLFERVKRQIHGTARMTRTEAFLQYAHEHPDEEYAAIEAKTDAMIRAFERGERHANPRKPSRGRLPSKRHASRKPRSRPVKGAKPAHSRRANPHKPPLWYVEARNRRGQTERVWGPMLPGEVDELREMLEYQASKRGLGETIGTRRAHPRAKARGKAELRRVNAKGKKGFRLDVGAQRELFMPASGQLEIVPSVQQKKLVKESAEKRTVPMFKDNPRRPPRAWWLDCIRRVRARGGHKVYDPRRVCGASWWKMPEAERAAVVRRLERGNPHQRGAALALARAEMLHRPRPGRRRNPRELVELVYEEQKPGDSEPFEYVHTFEGERPQLRMRGGALQVEGGTYRTKKGWIHG